MSTTPSWPGCCWTKSPPWMARSSGSPPGSSRRSRRFPLPAHQPPTRAAATAQPPATPSGRPGRCLATSSGSTPDRRDPGRGPPGGGPPGRGRRDRPPRRTVIIAEVGLDMAQFPTPGQLVSWARLSPRTIQSGATRRAGATGHGNPYLKAALGEAATAAAKTNTFLGERYRRLVKRIGKLKALVAIARSILIIVWHL